MDRLNNFLKEFLAATNQFITNQFKYHEYQRQKKLPKKQVLLLHEIFLCSKSTVEIQEQFMTSVQS